jgi:hypothetical protein
MSQPDLFKYRHYQASCLAFILLIGLIRPGELRES